MFWHFLTTSSSDNEFSVTDNQGNIAKYHLLIAVSLVSDHGLAKVGASHFGVVFSPSNEGLVPSDIRPSIYGRQLHLQPRYYSSQCLLIVMINYHLCWPDDVIQYGRQDFRKSCYTMSEVDMCCKIPVEHSPITFIVSSSLFDKFLDCH